MRIHVIQHVPFEGPAAIADWAAFHGYSVSSTHLFVTSAKLPSLDSFDILVVMGGPMGVHDTAEFAWLQAEIDFVRNALDASKFVLGVCLGAQIMAHALGGQVTQNPEREIGWFPLRFAKQSSIPWLASLGSELTAFHWHGETFSLPTGALAIAESDACKNQGFLWKGHGLALQFHLETTSASAEALLVNCGADLQKTGAYVQSADQIRAGAKVHSVALNRTLMRILDSWLPKG